jgi:hypothetical protein
MLQAHSLLWHYLWVAPNLLLFILAVVAYRRKLQSQFPLFVIFAAVTSIEQLVVYAADVIPAITPATWWFVFWSGLLLEALIKFAVVGELFGRVFGQYPSVAKLGKFLISGIGVALVLLAALVAAYTPKTSDNWIVSDALLLEQAIYMIACGLILFVFVFAAYFHLRWNRLAYGIAMGLGISACVHFATWAVMANGSFSADRTRLVFLNMATYHICVLVWFYYFFVPEKVIPVCAPPPEHDLEVWNQELERLLHQ